MAAKYGLLRGPKFNVRNTTIIEPALPFVQMLKTSPAVTKISLGIIKLVSRGHSRKGGSFQIKALVLPNHPRPKPRQKYLIADTRDGVGPWALSESRVLDTGTLKGP